MSDAQEPSHELRKTYRCPVPEGRQQAELRVGRRWLGVRLYNESSGGFAAWLEGDPRLQVGDRGQLYAEAGGFDVRIAHVGPADAVENDLLGAGDRREGATLYRLGLERLADLEPRGRQRSARDGLPRCDVPLQSHFGILLVAVLALLVVAAMLGAAALTTDPQVLVRFGLVRPPAPEGPVPRALPATGTNAAPLAEAARQTGLTRAAEERIEGLVEQTAAALRQLDRQWQDEAAEVRAAKQAVILEAAAREVWNRLPPEQQARWHPPSRPEPNLP
jgi:hypothetical protein